MEYGVIKHILPMSYPILPFWCHSFVPGKLHLCPTKPPIGKDESALASHLQKDSLCYKAGYQKNKGTM